MVWCTVPWDQIDRALLPPPGLQSGPKIIQQTNTEIITKCSNRVWGSLWSFIVFYPMGDKICGVPGVLCTHILAGLSVAAWQPVLTFSALGVTWHNRSQDYHQDFSFPFCTRQYRSFFKCHIKDPFSFPAQVLYCNIGLKCLLARCNEVKDWYAEDWNDKGGG